MCEPCLFDKVVTGCLWISKQSVHNLTLFNNILTSSPHVPQGLGVWFLLTIELCLFYQPPFFNLTIVVASEQPEIHLEIHVTTTVLLLDSSESSIKYSNVLVISFIALEFVM